MFSRAFMRNFNSNKYMNPIRQLKAGESKYFFPARDMPYFRFMLTGFVVLTTYLAYYDPAIFHEVVFHMHYPTHNFDVPFMAIQVISRGIPDQIRIPNEEALETHRQLNEIKDLIKLYK